LPGGARSSAEVTQHGLESHSGQGTCSADDGVGGPTAELVEVGNGSTAVTSVPAQSERGGRWHSLALGWQQPRSLRRLELSERGGLWHSLALGWRQPRSLRRLELTEHILRDADGASELETSDTGCMYHCGRFRAEHRCVQSHIQLALLRTVSRCTCATKHDALARPASRLPSRGSLQPTLLILCDCHGRSGLGCPRGRA